MSRSTRNRKNVRYSDYMTEPDDDKEYMDDEEYMDDSTYKKKKGKSKIKKDVPYSRPKEKKSRLIGILTEEEKVNLDKIIGYPYSVKTTCSDMGEVIKLYSNFDKEYLAFYDYFYEVERKKYVERNTNKSDTDKDVLNVYRNLAFKLDTLHDFLGEKYVGSLDTLLDLLGWKEDYKNFSGSKPEKFENNFFYWIIKQKNLKDILNKDRKFSLLRLSTTIENFADILSNSNSAINISVDAGEKRIDNFKNLVYFLKYYNQIKQEYQVDSKVPQQKIFCEIKNRTKAKNLALDIKDLKSNIIDETETIIDKKGTIDDDIESLVISNLSNEGLQKVATSSPIKFKIIYPQLFDANATTGKTVKMRGQNIETEIDQTYTQDLNFDIVGVNYQMKFDKNNKVNKTVILKVMNNDYFPIKEVVVIQKLDNKSSAITFNNINYYSLNIEGNKFYYNNENQTLICKDSGPGISQLAQLYNYFKSNSKVDKYIIATNIFNIKRAGDYSQVYFCKKATEQLKQPYIYSSNDRMSSSFCYIEGVSIISPFKDAGIYLDFNLSNQCNYPDKFDENKNENLIPFCSKMTVPDIGKYISFTSFKEFKYLNFFDNIFKYEYTNRSYQADIKKVMLDMAFKLDTIHDFGISGRGDKINLGLKNIVEYLGWKDILPKTSQGNYSIIDNMEGNLLYWLLHRQLNPLKDYPTSLYNITALPSLTFSTSIENYANCIISKPSIISIDASEERIENFKNLLFFECLKSYNKLQNINLDKIYKEIEKEIGVEYELKKQYDLFNYLKSIDSFYYTGDIIIYIYNLVLLYNLLSFKNSVPFEDYIGDNLKNYIYDLILNYYQNIIGLYNIKFPNDIIPSELTYETLGDYLLFINNNLQPNENQKNIATSIVSEYNVIQKKMLILQYLQKKLSIKYKIDNYSILDISSEKINDPEIFQMFVILHFISDFNLDEKELGKFTMNNIDEYCKSKIEELHNDFFMKSYDTERENLFLEKLTTNYSKECNQVQFKIIPSQLFDANATTGKSVSVRNFIVETDIDDSGVYCQHNYYYNNMDSVINTIKSREISAYNSLIALINIVKLNSNEFNVNISTIKEQLQNISSIMNDYKNKFLTIDLKEYLEDLEKLTTIIQTKYPADKILETLKIRFDNSKNIIKGDSFLEGDSFLKQQTDLFINTSNIIKYYLSTYYELITTNNNIIKLTNKNIELEEQILINNILIFSNSLLDSFNQQYRSFFSVVLNPLQNKKNLLNQLREVLYYMNDFNCQTTIIQDRVKFYESLDYTSFNYQIPYTTPEGNNIELTENIPCNIINLDITSPNGVNYPIQHIKVFKITDDTRIKEFVTAEQRKEKNYNPSPKITDAINKEFHFYVIREINKVLFKNNLDLIKGDTTTKLYKNYSNLSNQSNNRAGLHNLVKGKDFIYSSLNNTLYCITGPGVDDLAEMFNNIQKLYLNKFANKDIANNIFLIKRAGDYLQINYCKNNDYIFISNDRMSASFCFIDNCDFIGPFKDSGIFLRKTGTYSSCINIAGDSLDSFNCSSSSN